MAKSLPDKIVKASFLPYIELYTHWCVIEDPIAHSRREDRLGVRVTLDGADEPPAEESGADEPATGTGEEGELTHPPSSSRASSRGDKGEDGGDGLRHVPRTSYGG